MDAELHRKFNARNLFNSISAYASGRERNCGQARASVPFRYSRRRSRHSVTFFSDAPERAIDFRRDTTVGARIRKYFVNEHNVVT